jgi:hypothetical protein
VTVPNDVHRTPTLRSPNQRTSIPRRSGIARCGYQQALLLSIGSSLSLGAQPSWVAHSRSGRWCCTRVREIEPMALPRHAGRNSAAVGAVILIGLATPTISSELQPASSLTSPLTSCSASRSWQQGRGTFSALAYLNNRAEHGLERPMMRDVSSNIYDGRRGGVHNRHDDTRAAP